MPELTLVQAVNDALKTEMREDKRVVVLGEDVGKNGGVFRATDGLQAEFGEPRVIDTPLAEAGIIGAAIGMAVYGLRPVPEIQFQDFIFPAFDQIVNEAAKIRYRSGGQFSVPMVIRTPYGGGIRGGHYHSQSGEAYFTHTPGLKVVIPSNPYDTKGLLIASIRDGDPILFMEPKRLYRALKAEVPEGAYTVPLGKAHVSREGHDVTLVAYGAMHALAAEAAKELEAEGISLEIVDLRTIVPWDYETVMKSVKKTGRVVLVQEAPRTAGFAAELSATIAEDAIEYLHAPIVRVTGFDTPFPYTLEHDYMPTIDRIVHAVKKVKAY
ncbi:MAG TPA: alpha-ketoacid dehydrogenase subunit beta [Candidatus Thermoplasmatota archaeon]|nr:alpha-ketoacid dehydrogenase subunit beta [Candidatus Thermoplasmatota archaeon]